MITALIGGSLTRGLGHGSPTCLQCRFMIRRCYKFNKYPYKPYRREIRLLFIQKRTFKSKPHIDNIIPKFRKDGVSKEYQFVYGSGYSEREQRACWLYLIMFYSFASMLVVKAYRENLGLMEVHLKMMKYDLKLGRVKEPGKYIYISEEHWNMLLVGMAYSCLAFTTCFFFLVCRQNKLIRIYYNVETKQYIGIQLRFGLAKDKIMFTAKDVRKNRNIETGIITRNFSRDLEIKGKPYFVNPSSVVLPNHWPFCSGGEGSFGFTYY